SLGDHFTPQTLDVNAAPVVRDGKNEKPGAMTGLDADCSGGIFSGGSAFRRAFNAMVEAVADDVIQGRFQPLEYFAIYFGGGAEDFELHLLAELAGDVAHQPRECMNAISKWTHTA